jgi:hypothetical protein
VSFCGGFRLGACAEEVSVLDLSAAVALSVLPGALGAILLKAFLARSPVPPLSAFRLDSALADACPARAHEVLGRATAAAAPLLDDLAAGRRRAIRFGEPAYPPRLAVIPDPPPLLWINGDAAGLAHSVVAIVGSRYASPSSLDVAFALPATWPRGASSSRAGWPAASTKRPIVAPSTPAASLSRSSGAASTASTRRSTAPSQT